MVFLRFRRLPWYTLFPYTTSFRSADHFNQINDRFGHAAGVQVLVELAQLLRARLRTSDLPTRYGGEEFAILLPQTDVDNAYSLAEEICRGIAAEPVCLDDGDSIDLTVSIGVAALPANDQRPARIAGEALLQAADGAVYQAKREGRNRAVCADNQVQPQ